jgi:natural product biosynthesis luciferase-like monooxygenase protein
MDSLSPTSHIADTCSSLSELLFERANTSPDLALFTFITDVGVELALSVAELAERARAVAVLLLNRGIEPGDRALLLYPPGLEFLGAFFGCLAAGVVPVTAPYPSRPLARVIPRISSMAEGAEPSCVLSTARLRSDLRQELLGHVAALRKAVYVESDDAKPPSSGVTLPPIGRESTAFLQYTSGSTSQPRGVIVTHGNLLANCAQMRQPGASKIVSWLPMHHDFGLIYGVIQPVFSGTPAVLMSPGSFLQRPLRWLQAIDRFQGTHCPAPNFAFELCTRQVTVAECRSLNLGSWTAAVIAAEPIRPATLQRFVEHFSSCGVRSNIFLPAYGLAEATLFVTRGRHGEVVRLASPSDEARRDEVRTGGVRTTAFASCGQPSHDTQLLIVNPETLAECPDGTIGEVWLAGPSIAQGYFRRPIETEQTFRAHCRDGRGPYLRTGDLGFLRDAALYVTGRVKEMLLIRGENVYPYDLERSIERSHPQIVAGGVAAFSIETDDGEAVAALVELERSAFRQANKDAIAAAIRAAVSEEHGLSLAALELFPANGLPRTSSGKLQRALYRQAHQRGQLRSFRSCWSESDGAPLLTQPSGVVAASPVLLSELVTLVAALFQGAAAPPVDPDRPLRELGLDSVHFAELSNSLATRYGLSLDGATLFAASTRDLAAAVANVVEPRAKARPPALPAPLDALRPAISNTKDLSPPRSALHPGSNGAPPLELSLFCFGEANAADTAPYELVIESARLADHLGLHAVWLPERHFHAFGGVSPNPSVLAAALSRVTSKVRLRAGSVILPLHNPVRVAEEWAVIDNLSHGRVDLAFGWGWNANDFVLAPHNYEQRRELTLSGAELVRDLWRGKGTQLPNGRGLEREIHLFPRPVQAELPVWLTCTRSAESFIDAGACGYNVLTALLFQSVDELAVKIALYRAARLRNGHDPDAGKVTLMLHTCLGSDMDSVRRAVREPFSRYLASSVSLWRQEGLPLERLSERERSVAIELGFERYFQTSGLFGTTSSCLPLLSSLQTAGVSEVAALMDFGLDRDSVLDALPRLASLKQGAEPAGGGRAS